jgi:predicted RNase H-like HicB family nuclease
MDFYALIEEWPQQSLINFRELPGCLALAPTTEEALQKAPEAITAYRDWLERSRINFLQGEINPINVLVRERVRAERVGSRFETELIPPTDRELEDAITVAATARALIAELYNATPPAQRSQAVKPGEWSLAQHLQHILASDAHYVGCLSDQLPDEVAPVPAAELGDRLIENSRTYETFLRGMNAAQRGRVYIRDGAEWTMAKTLRRMTEHLCDHYPTTQDIARQLTAP